MFDPEEDGDPGLGVSLELVEAPGRVAVAEVAGPLGKEPVEPAGDRRDRHADQASGGEFACALSSTGHPPVDDG